MQQVESSPPLRAVAPFGLSLLLAAGHLLRPLLAEDVAIAPWRLCLGATLLLILAVAVAWLAQSKRYMLTSDSLEARRVGGNKSIHSLATLSSVGVNGAGLFGSALCVTFGDGQQVRIPRFYTNTGELFRALFSRLGSNLADQRHPPT